MVAAASARALSAQQDVGAQMAKLGQANRYLLATCPDQVFDSVQGAHHTQVVGTNLARRRLPGKNKPRVVVEKPKEQVGPRQGSVYARKKRKIGKGWQSVGNVNAGLIKPCWGRASTLEADCPDWQQEDTDALAGIPPRPKGFGSEGDPNVHVKVRARRWNK